LYDGDDAPADAPDLIVTRASDPMHPLHGSLVWDASTNTATWVVTGGVLVNDTYSVTLVSGPNAFTHGGGDDLDGNTNNPGLENYTHNFVVNSSTKIVTMPDFSRGPGQNVKLPFDNTGTGIPLTINNGNGVTSIDFNLFFNPQLLNITGANF